MSINLFPAQISEQETRAKLGAESLQMQTESFHSQTGFRRIHVKPVQNEAKYLPDVEQKST